MVKEFNFDTSKIDSMLNEFGLFFYLKEERWAYAGEYEDLSDVDLENIVDYLRNGFKSRKTIYKVSYGEENRIGIALGKEMAKEIVADFKLNEIQDRRYEKSILERDLEREKFKLERMEVWEYPRREIVLQMNWVYYLEEKLKNFDKELEKTFKEYIKVEKIK